MITLIALISGHSSQSIPDHRCDLFSAGRTYCHGTVVTAPRDVRRVLYLSSSYLAKNQLFHTLHKVLYVHYVLIPAPVLHVQGYLPSVLDHSLQGLLTLRSLCYDLLFYMSL